jgi:hypothetical protein
VALSQAQQMAAGCAGIPDGCPAHDDDDTLSL